MMDILLEFAQMRNLRRDFALRNQPIRLLWKKRYPRSFKRTIAAQMILTSLGVVESRWDSSLSIIKPRAARFALALGCWMFEPFGLLDERLPP